MSPSLNTTEIITLLDLLESPSTFQEISEKFRREFPDSDFHFKVCDALCQLLQESDLLTGPEQHLKAAFLIYDVERDSRQNPFLSLLIKLLHPPEIVTSLARLSTQARWFLSQLLAAPSESLPLLELTAKEVLSKAVEESAICDTSNLQVLLMEHLAELPAYDKIGVSCIVPAPKPGVHSEELRRESAIDILTCDAGSFGPLYHRLAPSLHLGEDVLTWIDPNSEYIGKLEPFWDDSMCSSSAPATEVKKMMARALKLALTPNQQLQLISDLKQEPRLVFQLGLSPSRLPDLVENNPPVAVEVLMLMMDSAQIVEFYSALVNMELSLHSMEVVNRLTTATKLPVEFIHQYVSNCIATCENMKDKYVQNRHVRLVCVFLSSLIRNKLIDVQELFIEVQAFCIDFSRIKEAAALFRLLKHVDPPEGSPENKSDVSNK
ncbi:CCR4-NOT transcription complex subunit 11 [Galendromus occidentalis]|uniref:CCR4-NOT transcription complex subunit 11 n=1 Tax=Galendromus occidentalis TaxID=34638 RepID=A0AAJ6QW89_9ACAR|nr:CCR4-NOT transcription complex subunit 11 [Galendromus occidentalis]